MVLASKIFLGALRIDLDLNIQKKNPLNIPKSGNPDFQIWMNQEGSEKSFTC